MMKTGKLLFTLGAVAIILASHVGCRTSSWSRRSASASVMKAWHEDRSYYALLEIVDRMIEPRYGPNAPVLEQRVITRTDVQRLLGDADDTAYPGIGANVWTYHSHRKSADTLYLVMEFNASNCVQDVRWVPYQPFGRLNLPVASHAQHHPGHYKDVNLGIDEKGTLYVFWKTANLALVEDLVTQRTKDGRRPRIWVGCDQNVGFEHVRRLLQTIRKAGVYKVDFATTPADEGLPPRSLSVLLPKQGDTPGPLEVKDDALKDMLTVTIGDGTLQLNGNTMDSASFDAIAKQIASRDNGTLVGVVPEDDVAMSELSAVLDILTKHRFSVALWLEKPIIPEKD